MKKTGIKILMVSCLTVFLFFPPNVLACTSSTECPSGSTCQFVDPTSLVGECTSVASSGCTTSAQCPSGSTCQFTDPSGLTGVCIGAGGTEVSPQSGTQNTGGGQALKNPLNTTNPAEILGNVINAVLGLVGSLALAIFVFGGFMWVTSAGNDERIKKGKDMIMWAALGLAVIFASYALVTFVLGAIVGSTGAGGLQSSGGNTSSSSGGTTSQSSGQ